MEDHWELEEQVNSKKSFLRFLNVLIADLHGSQEKEKHLPFSPCGSNANDWENPTLDRFLEAMHTWAFTSYAETGELNVPEELSWRTLAHWLSAAKVYE